MRITKLSALLLSAVLLASCAKVIDSLNPAKSFQSMQEGSDSPYTTTTPIEPPATPRPVGSAYSSSSKAPVLPQIIDVLTVNQSTFPQKKDGYDLSPVYHTDSGDVQFMRLLTTMRKHKHFSTSEVFYVISGQLTATLNDKASAVRAGTMIVVPPNTTFKLQNAENQPALLINMTTPASSAADVMWLE